MLGNNISGNIALNRLADIDLNGYRLTGNVSINSAASGTVNISAGTITGDLTINTANASVTNAATVRGTTNVQDVASSTFTNTGTLGTVNITDSNGTRFVNSGTAGIVNVNTAGNVKLEGSFTNEVKLKQAANVTIPSGTTVAQLTVESSAAGAKVDNQGTVQNVEGTGSVEIKGAAPEKVSNESATGEAVEKATGKRLEGVAAGIAHETTQEGLSYLTNRAVDTDKGSQVAVSYNDLVSLFTENQTSTSIQGKDFRGDNVTIADLGADVPFKAGGLALDLKVDGDDLVLGKGTKMSKTLFDAIKEQASADKSAPYNITITKKDTKTKLAKVSFEPVGDKIIAKLVK